jgi:hydrogenase-4 component B
MSPGALLLVAAASLVAGIGLGPWLRRTWLALTIGGAALALGAAIPVLLGPPSAAWEWRSVFLLGGEPLHLRLDGVSALILALVAVVGGTGALYASEYWPDGHYPHSAPRGRAWWSGLVLSMGLVLVSSNGLHFLIAWEAFTVCAYFLITLDRERREVRSAGWLYLAASHTGTVCLFAFFAALAARTGSWDLGPMREQAGCAPLFWLALVGFSVKAGAFPLHIWLPSAHANAPSHVSAIMSGVAIKMGIYGIVRFSGWLPVPGAAGWVVLGVGAVSAVFGIAFALAQDDLKRLLAYCSVENIGVIWTGLGAALLAATHGDAPWGRLALAGALLHVWNHGAFKSLLFFSAGSVLHATGTREMSRLGGLWRAMPWTTACFALGAVAVSGLPPLNGFVSELLIYLGLFDAAASRGPSAWVAMPAAIMLGMAGALALASFAKAAAVVFLGAGRTKTAARAQECGPSMRGAMFTLAGLCFAIGLAPVLFWPAVARAAGAWRPAWDFAVPPAPLATLGLLHVGLVIAGVVLAAGLAWMAQRRGLRRAVTWDCGYAAPSARMQYTSGSFSAIAAGWFGWLLQAERRVRRPRGPLPVAALRVERVPDTVLQRGIGPLAGAVMRVSTAVRRLQHGRLQSYIFYIAAGLVALAVFVVLGAKQ